MNDAAVAIATIDTDDVSKFCFLNMLHYPPLKAIFLDETKIIQKSAAGSLRLIDSWLQMPPIEDWMIALAPLNARLDSPLWTPAESPACVSCRSAMQSDVDVERSVKDIDIIFNTIVVASRFLEPRHLFARATRHRSNGAFSAV